MFSYRPLFNNQQICAFRFSPHKFYSIERSQVDEVLKKLKEDLKNQENEEEARQKQIVFTKLFYNFNYF